MTFGPKSWPEVVARLEDEGAIGSRSLEDFVARLERPRNVWMMVPATAVQQTLATIATLLEPGDALIDGGNSHYRYDIRRASQLRLAGIDYLDVGICFATPTAAEWSATRTRRQRHWRIRRPINTISI